MRKIQLRKNIKIFKIKNQKKWYQELGLSRVCESCGKTIDEKATWSAGAYCDYYCSKECCNKVYIRMTNSLGINVENPFICSCY